MGRFFLFMFVKILTMQYGSMFRRFLAGLFDYSVIYFLTYGYANAFGTVSANGGVSVTGLKALPIPVIWFLLTCVTEQLFGATVGNGMLQLKPVDIRTKQKPDWLQTFKRHLADPLDMFFCGLVAVILMKKSPNRQRLGDQWADTIVVKDK